MGLLDVLNGMRNGPGVPSPGVAVFPRSADKDL